MYAVIEAGGKQYKVTKDLVLRIEKVDAEVGSTLTFEPLFVNNDGKTMIGNPTVKGVSVKAEVLAQGKADKVLVATYNPKHRTRSKYGHRQPYTAIKIKSID
jgi:large subunit ribosomal protein L21